jgi:hypothetical protein
LLTSANNIITTCAVGAGGKLMFGSDPAYVFNATTNPFLLYPQLNAAIGPTGTVVTTANSAAAGVGAISIPAGTSVTLRPAGPVLWVQ